jgi:hypothetical protein
VFLERRGVCYRVENTIKHETVMAMVLSVFLEFTASYYIFGIFKPCYRVENTTKHETALAIVLSLFLEFTASYYIFDIFKPYVTG